MKMFITSTLVLLAGAMTYSNLHNHKDCLGFLPQNNLQIPVMANFTQGSGLTESQFNEIIDRVESVYTELVAETGHTLNIRRHWSKLQELKPGK